MSEIVLKHSDGAVLPWLVPVPDGSTAEAVAEAWAGSGWSLAEDLSVADAPAPVNTDVPAEPATPDAAPADVATTERN